MWPADVGRRAASVAQEATSWDEQGSRPDERRPQQAWQSREERQRAAEERQSREGHQHGVEEHMQLKLACHVPPSQHDHRAQLVQVRNMQTGTDTSLLQAGFSPITWQLGVQQMPGTHHHCETAASLPAFKQLAATRRLYMRPCAPSRRAPCERPAITLDCNTHSFIMPSWPYPTTKGDLADGFTTWVWSIQQSCTLGAQKVHPCVAGPAARHTWRGSWGCGAGMGCGLVLDSSQGCGCRQASAMSSLERECSRG